MTDPATQLAACLPADPADNGPIVIPNAHTLRTVLAELADLRKRSARRDRAEALVNGTWTDSAAIPDGEE